VADRALLDTGFVVALVNGSDPAHREAAAFWEPWRGEVVTVEGILVEAAWLLRKARGGPRAAIDLVLDSGARVVAPTERRLRRAVHLMETYASVPMDFVDAQLVALAEEERLTRVLTFDRRGFSTYRLNGKRRFEVLP
jgi:predicted nucleic acid-binding protein